MIGGARPFRRRRFNGDISAAGAVEFALLLPVLLLVTMLLVDFSYAFYVRLRIVAAVNAASIYAFENGQNLSSSTVTAYISSIQTVAISAAGLKSPPTVTVLVNNAPDTSNYNNYYCLAGSKPVVWTSTSTVSIACPSVAMSGKFVTITVKSTTQTLFKSDPILGSMVTAGDHAIVRLQ